MAQTVAMKLMTRYYGGNVLRGTFLECQRRIESSRVLVHLLSLVCDYFSKTDTIICSLIYLMVELDNFTLHCISQDKRCLLECIIIKSRNYQKSFNRLIILYYEYGGKD